MPHRLPLSWIATSLLGGLLCAAPALADDAEWPKEITLPHATVTVYQPQVERYEGTDFEARAAVAVSRDGGAPEFGAIWVQAQVDSDRDERVATLREVKVPRVRFAEASEAEQAQLAKIIEEAVPDSGLSISLDLLIADMEPSGRNESEKGLKHDAPRIYYRSKPTILITLDGEPIYQDVQGTRGVEKVVNTPFTLVRFQKSLYLAAGGGLWYQAGSLEGPWQPGVTPPAAVALLEPEDAGIDLGADDDEAPTEPPDVLVVNEPSELVVSAGAPTWTPMADAELLYLDNSDSDVFLEVSTQRYYVLLSGRWYRGHAMGDRWEWEHVANDALPRAFARIPEDSVNGHVLPQVGGTVQARDAVLDNTIPQTAAVKRQGGTPLSVQYDGKPKFEGIEGIPARYAVNTPSAVFDVGKHYWACEQGVWYDADSPTGPWAVSTQVPEVLYRIPPSNPHYNVTYVKVYQSTPQVVYVGYTPAYLGSYVYAGSVVYGTGWAYRPWYGRYYYPRTPTWGFNVSYNPWSGWGFGVSWSNGPFSFGVGFGGGYGGGWFGPVGYRPWGRPYVGGGFHKTKIDIDRNINIGDINIDRSRRANVSQNINNVYNRGNNRDLVVQRPQTRPGIARPGQGPDLDRPAQRPDIQRPAQRPDVTRPAQRPETRPGIARPSTRPNDVLTDRSGNVYRRAADGAWQQRANRDWSGARDLDRPRPQVQRPSAGTRDIQRPSAGTRQATRPQLERSQQARMRGAQRSASFQRQRPSGGGGRARGRR